MNKTSVFLAILLFPGAAMTLTAQDKLFTADDYLNPDLYPKTMTGLSWRGDKNVFTWVEDNNLLQKSPINPGNTDTLLSLASLNASLGMQEIELPGRFPHYKWIDNNRFYFIEKGKIFIFDFAGPSLKLVNEYDKEGENVTIDPFKQHVAYTRGNNLFVAADGKTIQVTEEKDSAIVYGQIPSRNEFGIDAGSYWSPDGERLAFYRTDQTEVTDYPLVDLFARIAEAAPVKYPMAGMKSQKVTLGIFNTGLNEIVYMQTPGPENQYITSVTWDPSGRFIYMGILNRGQDHFRLNKYDAGSGEFIRTLFEESNERYVEPLHGLHFLKADPSEFIWQSRRDGWNHLYLYDTGGNLIKQVTRGEWEVTEFLGEDPQAGSVYYESTRDSPLERHLYRTEIKTGRTERITGSEGVHSIKPAAGMTYFIDIFSSPGMALAYYLLDQKGNRLARLKEDPDPYKDYRIGEMSIFKIRADDGHTDLYCRLIRPPGFDPAKKYPALVYVYGGPHVQLIDKSWTGGAGFWLNLMAQQGYVIFTLDNRGSANRGFEFESIIHRQLGEVEMEDQMTGVRYLKSLGYIDTARLGVDGWSYGGFMTVSLMIRHPGVFRVACAGGPVIDWKWYEVMYGERYMDTPEENPAGYEKASLMNYAGNLNGRLLIIHGTNDKTVVWQNSLMFLDQCVRQGKQPDYFVYPGAGHNMTGAARVHLFNKIKGYFKDYL